MTENKGTRDPAKTAIVTVVSFFGLTMLFFPVAEVYLQNPFEFGLDPVRALVPFFLVMLPALFAVTALLYLLLKKQPVIFRCLLYALFGFTVAGYIQNLFFNGRMGLLDGHHINNLYSRTYLYASYYGYIILAAVPLFVYIISEKTHKPALYGIMAEKYTAVIFLSGALIAMQTAGIASLIPGYVSSEKVDQSRKAYLSLEPALQFSEKENIIVFILDRLDKDYSEDMLERCPELCDALDGFTFYTNNTSNFLFTYPSVPTMLSGCTFLGMTEERPELFDRIWGSEQNLMRIMKSSGWRVNLILDDYTTYGTLDRLYDIADNIKYTYQEPEYNYFGSKGIIINELYLACAKMLPDIAKDTFLSKFGFAYFVEYDPPIPDKPDSFVSNKTDIIFNEYLKEHGASLSDSEKTFTVIHLNCTHNPDRSIAELYPGFDGGEESMEVSSARGDFCSLEMLFSEMKRLGVYDSTTILLMGDHGKFPVEIGQDFYNKRRFADRSELFSPILTSLMIKPAHAAHAPLVTDDSPLSHEFFPASILEYAGIDHSSFGPSYQDVISGTASPERKLFLDEFCQAYYVIKDDANDFENWSYNYADGPVLLYEHNGSE